MSGKSAAYRMRPRKEVDRRIFIELLSKLDGKVPLHKYAYVGFGGHSFEDFREIHSFLNVRNMISLENDSNIVERQKINLPLSGKYLRNIHSESSDFIERFEEEVKSNAIVWLDHTTKELWRVLIEFENLLRKARQYDIVKITLMAHAPYLFEQGNHTGLEKRLKKFDMLAGDFKPDEVGINDMKKMEYPSVVYRALRMAAEEAFATTNEYYYQPLTAFHYQDTTRMLTATGIVLSQNEEGNFIDTLRNWDHAMVNWEKPRDLDVPDLTPTEKRFLDNRLPGTPLEKLQKSLGFYFGDGEDEGKRLLENYIRYYRHYPSFAKLWV